jgi:hypothetical protein
MTKIRTIEEGTYDAMKHAAAAVIASGTATVEAALSETPMVVVYRLGRATYALGRPFVKVPFFSMVNLVAGRRLVAELIQDDMTPQAIQAEVERLLEPRAAAEMKRGLREVREKLGGKGASARAAEAVFGLHRKDPWPSSIAMQRNLDLAVEMASRAATNRFTKPVTLLAWLSSGYSIDIEARRAAIGMSAGTPLSSSRSSAGSSSTPVTRKGTRIAKSAAVNPRIGRRFRRFSAVRTESENDSRDYSPHSLSSTFRFPYDIASLHSAEKSDADPYLYENGARQSV